MVNSYKITIFVVENIMIINNNLLPTLNTVAQNNELI